MVLMEWLTQVILMAATAVAFVAGWVAASFAVAMYVFGAGVLVALAVCTPDWGFYNTAPKTFLEPVSSDEAQFNILDLFPSEAAKTAAEIRVSGGEVPTRYNGSSGKRRKR